LAVACWAGCQSGFVRVNPDGGDAADLGSAWQVVHDNPDGGDLHALFGVAADNVHAVGDNGVVVAWDGNALTELGLGGGYDLTSGWGANATDQWISGVVHGTPNGVLFHLGTTPALRWVQANRAPIPNGLLGVWGVDDQRFATGYNGTIYSTNAAGPFNQGIQVPASPCHGMMTFAPMLWSVSGNSATSIGVAGDVCTNYFFDGVEWKGLINPDATRIFRSVFGPPGATTDLYFGGNYYGLWHYDGTPLQIQLNEERGPAASIGLYLWGIWGPDSQHILAVGDAGRILTYDAGTQKVAILPPPTTRRLYAIWGSSLDDVWIAGEGGLILRGSVAF
jgi:hypothetical protein